MMPPFQRGVTDCGDTPDLNSQMLGRGEDDVLSGTSMPLALEVDQDTGVAKVAATLSEATARAPTGKESTTQLEASGCASAGDEAEQVDQAVEQPTNLQDQREEQPSAVVKRKRSRPAKNQPQHVRIQHVPTPTQAAWQRQHDLLQRKSRSGAPSPAGRVGLSGYPNYPQLPSSTVPDGTATAATSAPTGTSLDINSAPSKPGDLPVDVRYLPPTSSAPPLLAEFPQNPLSTEISRMMDQIKRAVNGIAIQVFESLDRETQALPSPVRRRVVELPSVDSDIENCGEILESGSMASAARSGRSAKASIVSKKAPGKRQARPSLKARKNGVVPGDSEAEESEQEESASEAESEVQDQAASMAKKKPKKGTKAYKVLKASRMSKPHKASSETPRAPKVSRPRKAPQAPRTIRASTAAKEAEQRVKRKYPRSVNSNKTPDHPRPRRRSTRKAKTTQNDLPAQSQQDSPTSGIKLMNDKPTYEIYHRGISVTEPKRNPYDPNVIRFEAPTDDGYVVPDHVARWEKLGFRTYQTGVVDPSTGEREHRVVVRTGKHDNSSAYWYKIAMGIIAKKFAPRMKDGKLVGNPIPELALELVKVLDEADSLTQLVKKTTRWDFLLTEVTSVAKEWKEMRRWREFHTFPRVQDVKAKLADFETMKYCKADEEMVDADAQVPSRAIGEVDQTNCEINPDTQVSSRSETRAEETDGGTVEVDVEVPSCPCDKMGEINRNVLDVDVQVPSHSGKAMDESNGDMSDTGKQDPNCPGVITSETADEILHACWE